MSETSVERPCRPVTAEVGPPKEPVPPAERTEAVPACPEAGRREGVVSDPDF